MIGPQASADAGFSFSGRLRSVRYAMAGVRHMLVSQHNAWVHLAATVLAVAAGVVLEVSRVEWGLVLMAIVAVWVAEGLNTAFEFLCDVASPQFHPAVKHAKDVAAGAVLIAAAGAVAIGLLVFGPRLVAMA